MSDTDATNDLKRQRRSLKTKLTKFSNFINDEQNQTKFTEIKLRLKKLDGILESFEKIQIELDEITREESDEYDIFESQYFKVISQAQDLIDQPNSSTSLDQTVISNIASNNATNNDIKLPDIELVTFDGSVDKWLDFQNYFTSVIHNNTKLANWKKLRYLRSSLKALSIIKGLDSTDANYSEA